jgi:hypothetical protein
MGPKAKQTSPCIQASLCVDHKAGAALERRDARRRYSLSRRNEVECETWMNGTRHLFITHPLPAPRSHNTQPVPLTHTRP